MFALRFFCEKRNFSNVRLRCVATNDRKTRAGQVGNSVPSKKIHTDQKFVLMRTQLRNHVDTQPAKRFKRCKGYALLNSVCCKCARMRFHCANCLVVLRIYAP